MQVATVGTAAGGVGEIITDGVDGVLVPPADPEALAGTIRHLVEDEDRRKRIAAAGRLKIVERFDSRLGAATLYERITGHALEVEVAVSSSKPAATTSGTHTTSNPMSTHS